MRYMHMVTDLRASYFRFSGLCVPAVGATASIIPLLVVTAAPLPGRPATPGTNDAGPLLVSRTRPGGSIIPDVGGRTSIRRASDVTMNRCWARIACRCCNVRPAKFGIIGRPPTVCNKHTLTLTQSVVKIKAPQVISLHSSMMGNFPNDFVIICFIILLTYVGFCDKHKHVLTSISR